MLLICHDPQEITYKAGDVTVIIKLGSMPHMPSRQRLRSMFESCLNALECPENEELGPQPVLKPQGEE